jgi:hypothetical protein
MAAHVTSHRMPHVLSALIAIAVLFAAGWLIAYLTRPAPPVATPVPAAQTPVPPLAAPILPEVDTAQDLARPPAPTPRRRQHSGVPLDAPVVASPEDFEVLSAAELDAISQARD